MSWSAITLSPRGQCQTEYVEPSQHVKEVNPIEITHAWWHSTDSPHQLLSKNSSVLISGQMVNDLLKASGVARVLEYWSHWHFQAKSIWLAKNANEFFTRWQILIDYATYLLRPKFSLVLHKSQDRSHPHPRIWSPAPRASPWPCRCWKFQISKWNPAQEMPKQILMISWEDRSADSAE